MSNVGRMTSTAQGRERPKLSCRSKTRGELEEDLSTKSSRHKQKITDECFKRLVGAIAVGSRERCEWASCHGGFMRNLV